MHPTAVQHWHQLKGDHEVEWRDTPGIWFFCLGLGGLDVDLLLAGLWTSTMFGSKVNVHDLSNQAMRR